MTKRRYAYVNYDGLPVSLRDGAERYIERGEVPGHFLTAVFENNLSEAVARADSYNLSALPQIVDWVFNEAPSTCWGSKERVDTWSRKHGEV